MYFFIGVLLVFKNKKAAFSEKQQEDMHEDKPVKNPQVRYPCLKFLLVPARLAVGFGIEGFLLQKADTPHKLGLPLR